ncbi:hypothetical protein AAZX31_11G025300 [Glycine max]|uniref:C2 domain-containing protein n=2 Tax=Glycine subgen. Soja TaxID=1462606 RepID=C6SZS0_SOYBN|nr:uncharacterized protein LOC100306532 [Glycine max]XP_028188640.1 uncharacterized protein LOC114375092 [Glycine soja]ACU14743.1 unknown [Glycine max]KAG4972951.1 hypothetical protein JHK87_029772 [Glycine soja]KAG4993139.1 hypothetical protein JHK86_029966 [Glycine max]KAG5144561.1 hypothetical protein JHK84_030104 [Glycine max]KAH1157238.1 hypothetical protein GYH30_029826 [Glycine max]|eukprot:NP_001236371.1 uncharacterized protein LOC100306532 [Glycine max]
MMTTTTTTLEICVVSAEGLKQQSSSYFSCIRPFITLTKLPAHMVYHHYDEGGTGEQVFRVPVDPTFFSDTYSRLHLQLYNKRRFAGLTQLGSCLIPPSDIALQPYHSVRYLSYRLRAKDGSRTHLTVNLSIRLHGSPDLDTCQPVIGIPVTAVRKFRNAHSSSGSTSSKMETEFQF